MRARFPHVARLCAKAGLDLTADLLPVSPAAHYLMGGVLTDLDGRTTLPGLFAAGEAACTGVHGVVAFSVSSRTREVGIRMALGARRREVVGMVLRQGAAQLALGFAIGGALAWGFGRLASSLQDYLQGVDPRAFAIVVTAGNVIMPLSVLFGIIH